MKIQWDPDGVRRVEQRYDEALAHLAVAHTGGTDDEIRQALTEIGFQAITPDLIEMIRCGEAPKARFET